MVRFGLVLTAAGFAAVAASRVAMIYSPYFEEIQYERAPMGLEALAILRGETPVMNWSEPYHGTVFSYLLAPFYALGGDSRCRFANASGACCGNFGKDNLPCLER